jgi:hypothetical protein
VLLAHADGELSPLADIRVRRHLKKCWECRARLAELEQQAEELARAFRQGEFPGPEWIDRARSEMTARQQCAERDLARARRSAPGVRPLLPAPVYAMLLVVALAVGAWFYSTRAAPAPRAAEILARAQKRESEPPRAAVPFRQTVQVEVVQETPRRQSSAGVVRIWSDFPSGRFALRWEGPGGTLKHAVWRPDGANDVVYHAGRHPRWPEGAPEPRNLRCLADLSRYALDDPEILEAAFFDWLQQWHWRPLSLSSDFASFANQEGVRVSVERLQSGSGTPLFRVSAVREDPRLRVQLILEVDGQNWQLRLQRVRFSAAGRTVEFRLAASTPETIPPAQLLAAVFRPDIPARRGVPAPRELTLDLPRGPAGGGAASTETVRPRLVPWGEPRALEIEVLYALHLVRACLGEPVEIVRGSDGAIEVRGLVKTGERKAEILSALTELQVRGAVTVNLQTTAEAMGQGPGSSGTPERRSEVRWRRLPIEDELERYFEKRRVPGGAESPRVLIARLADTAVASGEAALAEAWALRRLIEKYPPEETLDLDARSRRLVQIMTRDHTAELWTRLAALRGVAEPALISVLGGCCEAGGLRRVPESQAAYLELFGTVREINDLVRALFAGTEFPAGVTVRAGEAALRRTPAQQSVLEVLGAFVKLEDDFRRFEAQMNSAGSNNAGTRSSSQPRQ